jgi:hypothetical protein
MTEPELMLDWKDKGGNATIESPMVCIVLLTYERTRLALRRIDAVCKNLDYPAARLMWYIADDGSCYDHINTLLNRLKDNNQKIIGYHNQRFAPAPYCGAGWNRALVAAHNSAPIVLWLEDDWELKGPLDIRPYVRLLIERDDVGLVRLGHLAVGNLVEIVGWNGIHYLLYRRETNFAYSGNPLLRHVRFAQYYGAFPTNQTPGDLEIEYDFNFRSKMPAGPNIWRPTDIPSWGIWGHIGEERTW